ncbi:MAG: GDP-fucose synthetase [Porticoccaceae bacterium]|nr:GDP-fucose synthetase [Porticoccaceae bacterium]
MNLHDKIFVAGHLGLVGSNILKRLQDMGFTNLLVRTHKDLDLTVQADVNEFFLSEKPCYVILAAGKVGGILANNTYPADFIYKNIMIQANVIEASFKSDVKKLLFLGSTCIYPKQVPQPMSETALLTNTLEPTNEPYALAKIAGIKLCESYNRQYGTDYRSVMPTNLYGENDNFHLENSHVIPAIMRKFHLAKCIETNNWDLLREDLRNTPIAGVSFSSSENLILKALNDNGISVKRTGSSQHLEVSVSIWGTGQVRREFLHVDDMVSGSIFLLTLDKESYKSNTRPMLSHVNIGTGKDITIKDLAETLKDICKFKGTICFDHTKPDGPKQKLTDVSRINEMGWSYKILLKDGLRQTYNNYTKKLSSRRSV